MKNNKFKRYTICIVVYVIAALASFFAGYFSNPCNYNTAEVEETVWETDYVSECDYYTAQITVCIEENIHGNCRKCY